MTDQVVEQTGDMQRNEDPDRKRNAELERPDPCGARQRTAQHVDKQSDCRHRAEQQHRETQQVRLLIANHACEIQREAAQDE